MWQIKKQSACKICKINQGTQRNVLMQSCSYWHYSYGFHKHVLCHWCYETLMLFEKPLPIDYLLSSSYKQECQLIGVDEDEMWTRRELNQFKTYIDGNDLHVLLQILDDNGLRWSNFRNYTPDAPIYQDRTTLCNKFITLRQERIDKVNIKNQKDNEIATVKLLYYEHSYIKILPKEIVDIILSYV